MLVIKENRNGRKNTKLTFLTVPQIREPEFLKYSITRQHFANLVSRPRAILVRSLSAPFFWNLMNFFRGYTYKPKIKRPDRNEIEEGSFRTRILQILNRASCLATVRLGRKFLGVPSFKN